MDGAAAGKICWDSSPPWSCISHAVAASTAGSFSFSRQGEPGGCSKHTSSRLRAPPAGSLSPTPGEPLGGLPETQSREGVAGPQLSSSAASSPVPGVIPWLQTPLDRSCWDGLSASHSDKGLPLTAMPCWGAEKSRINPNPAGREDCASVPHRKSSVV